LQASHSLLINDDTILPHEKSMPIKAISVCHGQNCRDVGGKALSEALQQRGIEHAIIPCQALCTYAPTAKIGKVAILKANLEQLLTDIAKT